MSYVTIYFVRHGDKQAKKNYSDIEGQALELTPLGYTQAQATGKYLAKSNVHFAQIISSPYLRCRQTARTIVESLGQGKIVYNASLSERVLHRQDLPKQQALTNLRRARQEHRWAPAGGESYVDVHRRFDTGLEVYLSGGTCPVPKNILVVTHRKALEVWLGFTFERADLLDERTQLDTCSLTVVRCVNGRFSLLNFNDTRHLEGLGRTKELLLD